MVVPSNDNNKSAKSENIFGQPLTIFGIPVDRETIFQNHKGIYKKQMEKRQRKLIVKSTAIKFFLQENETISCLTTGYSPVPVLEQVLTGPAFLFFKRALLIFTNKRILHVPTTFDRTLRSTVSQILYEDCACLEVKGRSLHVYYKNGRDEVFPYIGRKEKKKIKTLISNLTLTPKDAGRLKGRVYLCPSCTSIVPKAAKACGTCGLSFKTSAQAKAYALLVPGGGYLYGRFTVAGAVTALVELGLMGFIAMTWLNGHPQSLLGLWSTLLPALAALIAIKSIAAYHAGNLFKDLIPGEKEFPREKKSTAAA